MPHNLEQRQCSLHNLCNVECVLVLPNKPTMQLHQPLIAFECRISAQQGNLTLLFFYFSIQQPMQMCLVSGCCGFVKLWHSSAYASLAKVLLEMSGDLCEFSPQKMLPLQPMQKVESNRIFCLSQMCSTMEKLAVLIL